MFRSTNPEMRIVVNTQNLLRNMMLDQYYQNTVHHGEISHFYVIVVSSYQSWSTDPMVELVQ